MMDIDQLAIIAIAGAKAASAGGRAYEDGKIGLGDINELWSAAFALKELFSVDFNEAKVEWKDLDQAEIFELQRRFADNFKLPQGEAEKMVEGYLNHGMTIYTSIQSAISFHKKQGFGK
jgi:hypothetical protein